MKTYTPHMIVVPFSEWEAMQNELNELRKLVHGITDDPQVSYAAQTDWKAIVDSGKTIENDEGTKVWGGIKRWNRVYCYSMIDESETKETHLWFDIEYIIKQTKGWRVI